MLATKLKGSLDSRSSFKRPLNFDVCFLSNGFCLATAFPPNQSYVCRAQPWTRTKLKSGLNHISQALPPPRKVIFCRVSVCFFHDSAVPRTRCLQQLGFIGGAQKQTATVPSQDRPWEVTPERLSLHTLQKVGRAWEQAYQLCIPEKCSTLNWATCKGKVRTGLPNRRPRLTTRDSLQRSCHGADQTFSPLLWTARHLTWKHDPLYTVLRRLPTLPSAWASLAQASSGSAVALL